MSRARTVWDDIADDLPKRIRGIVKHQPAAAQDYVEGIASDVAWVVAERAALRAEVDALRALVDALG